jgi:hypothetical protein
MRASLPQEGDAWPTSRTGEAAIESALHAFTGIGYKKEIIHFRQLFIFQLTDRFFTIFLRYGESDFGAVGPVRTLSRRPNAGHSIVRAATGAVRGDPSGESPVLPENP